MASEHDLPTSPYDDAYGSSIAVLSFLHARRGQAGDAARGARPWLLLRCRDRAQAHPARGVAAGLDTGTTGRHAARTPDAARGAPDRGRPAAPRARPGGARAASPGR